MRLADAMKPALEWTEAAMLPAELRTLAGGAALETMRRQAAQTRWERAVAAFRPEAAAAAPDPARERMLALRRAAFRQASGNRV